ncbi:MAG: hypothetical protein EBU14_15030 [Acetobacteraceae bacterium]|nr:hypothetical protein [Acetobacteraceae bacterium]
MSDTTAAMPATPVAGRKRYQKMVPWILLGAAGLLLPLLDDAYIGVIAQRAFIYWILSVP